MLTKIWLKLCHFYISKYEKNFQRWNILQQKYLEFYSCKEVHSKVEHTIRKLKNCLGKKPQTICLMPHQRRPHSLECTREKLEQKLVFLIMIIRLKTRTKTNRESVGEHGGKKHINVINRECLKHSWSKNWWQQNRKCMDTNIYSEVSFVNYLLMFAVWEPKSISWHKREKMWR